MATPQPLRNPPIVEALIDLRILTATAVSKESLLPLVADLKETMPGLQQKVKVEANFRVEAGRMVPPEAKQIFQGVKVATSDGRRQAQFRTDGFTFNNVGPYIGGDALIRESLELWDRYSAVVKPQSVTRIAMRYINKLALPWQAGDPFTRFLKAVPELPEPGPQSVSMFASRVVAHDPLGATAVVAQKMDPVTPPAEHPTLTIDCDVFMEKELPIDAAALRPLLEVLRDVKNRCFFSLLDDEAVKLYL